MRNYFGTVEIEPFCVRLSVDFVFEKFGGQTNQIPISIKEEDNGSTDLQDQGVRSQRSHGNLGQDAGDALQALRGLREGDQQAERENCRDSERRESRPRG